MRKYLVLIAMIIGLSGAALADAATGRIAIYYGAADTVVAMAFTQVDELIAHIKEDAM